MHVDSIKAITLKGQNEKSERWVSAMIAFAIGCAWVLLVGFAPFDVAHKEAHDTRHALSFPCH